MVGLIMALPCMYIAGLLPHMFVGLRRCWGSKVKQQHGLPSQKHPVSLWDLLHWSTLVSLASAHVVTIDP